MIKKNKAVEKWGLKILFLKQMEWLGLSIWRDSQLEGERTLILEALWEIMILGANYVGKE